MRRLWPECFTFELWRAGSLATFKMRPDLGPSPRIAAWFAGTPKAIALGWTCLFDRSPAHVLHATEIIGYKHPDDRVADRWRWFYSNLAKCFHLNPETEEQLDERLGACEDQFARNAEIAHE